MIVEFDPQPTIHDPQCPAASGGNLISLAKAVQQYPYALTHHCARTGVSRATVVLVPAVNGHWYKASTIWPANASRELCVHCRGTHPGEFSRSGSHIGAYYGDPNKTEGRST